MRALHTHTRTRTRARARTHARTIYQNMWFLSVSWL